MTPKQPAGRVSRPARSERLAPALSPRAGGADGGWRDGGTSALPRAAGAPSRRVAWWAAGSAALLLVPGLVLALWATAPTAAELDARWRRSAGFDPLAAFPAREANAAAMRLEEIVRPLGFELAPARSDRRPRLRPAAATNLAPLSESVRAALQELRRPRPGLARVPATATARLDAVRPQLLAAREVLTGAQPPRWERDLGDARGGPVPDMLGHQRLHRLLVFAAHEAARAGDADEAGAWLEAAWRLYGSLADEPLYFEQLVAAAELQDELALLRALPAPPPGWRERLDAHRVRPRIHRSLRVEGWLGVQTIHRGLPLGRNAEPPEGYLLRRVLWPFWWVLVRHGVGHAVDGVDHAITRAEREGVAALDDGFVAAERARVPWWSRTGRQLLGNLVDGPVRAARGELGVELTRQVVELRQGRGHGSQSGWPAHASDVPGVEWHREPIAGGVVVSATRQPPALGPHPLPLMAELRW